MFEQVILTEEETAEALRSAREVKYYLLKRIAYLEYLNQPVHIRKMEWHYYHAEFLAKLDVDADNEEIIMQLCHFFAESPEFKSDLSKGILLAGGVGVGKTTIMDFFKKNQRRSFRMMSCRDVEKKFSEDGTIDYFSFNIPVATNSDPFGHQEIGFCFDDLGTESNAKNYGREKNIMAEVILNRYDNRLPDCSTYLTTNLGADEIATQYGSRVMDRLREMMNIIEFKPSTKSRRK